MSLRAQLQSAIQEGSATLLGIHVDEASSALALTASSVPPGRPGRRDSGPGTQLREEQQGHGERHQRVGTGSEFGASALQTAGGPNPGAQVSVHHNRPR